MNLGFIGLGNMGGAIAARLVQAQQTLSVMDIRTDATREFADAGARVCATPAEVARCSDLVFTCLPGPEEMRAVALGNQGILEGVRAGTICVDLTTNSPDLVREVARCFDLLGTAFLDAPVSGGPMGARAGTLAVYVGGNQSTLERCRSILEVFGKGAIQHCGPLGSGNVVKLCNNLLNNVLKCLLPEVFALGVKAGMTARALFEALASGPADSMMLRLAARGYLESRTTGSFPGVAVKDVGLALDLAHHWGVHAPIGTAVLDRLRVSMDGGYGIDLWRLVEHEGNVTLQFSPSGDSSDRGATFPGSEIVRLCTNLVSATMRTANPEAFAIGIRGGIDQRVLYDGIRGGTGYSAVLETQFRPLLEARTCGREPIQTPPLAVVVGGLKRTREIATVLGLAVPITDAVLARIGTISEAGQGIEPFLQVEMESGVRFGFPRI
ncbi:MAG: NAD(P)-binding domain-containing protein [Gammaproteobacteria bacterium]